MIKILLNGCNGRMGQAIAAMAEEHESISVVCGVDINAVQRNSFPVYGTISEAPPEADVLIDFSNPSGLEDVISYLKAHKLPSVIATTGLSKLQTASLYGLAGHLPVFYSANMSLGINLLIDLVTKAAAVLERDYDIEILERHHNQKLDAPSGTALHIADSIGEVLSSPPQYIYDRHSVRKKRTKEEIGIHAIRGGSIVGDHTVLFAGRNETIEISHHAASREVFAAGALRASEFIFGKPAGLYDMKSLIKEYK